MPKQFLKLQRNLSPPDIILLFAPLLIYMSHHPLISFGYQATHGFFLEPSLTMLYLVALALSYLPRITRNLRPLLKKPPVRLVLIFLAYHLLSLTWSDNFLRGFLTTGLIGALTLIFLGLLSTPKLKSLLPALARLLLATTTLFALFGWFQMAADLINVPESLSLLCAGCRAHLFGFARVNAFAVEPQFFGSLLLVPIFLLAAHLTSPLPFLSPSRQTPSSRRLLVFLLLFFTATLFLTMSRGAIFALAIGFLVYLAYFVKQLPKILLPTTILIGGFLLALIVQGATAALNPHVTETFSGAITKVIHQTSLGVIDLRPSPSTPPPDALPTDPVVSPPPPTFDGYIEESTSSRTMMSQLAITTWLSSPRYLTIGAGIGGSPDAIFNHHQSAALPRREITNNLYTETLLELGLLGFTLFISLLVGLGFLARRHPASAAILAAILVQWCFFSGYPNALHIYLLCLLFAATRFHRDTIIL